MPEVKASPMIAFPQVVLADELQSALPLELTQVSVQITGPVASVVVSQRFGNPLKDTAELDYLFPLPEHAAITGFELRVGQRQILGNLQEQEAARIEYEEARQQGKRAGLFEQRRPNLFAVRLANVRAGETIQATVRYQQRVKFEDDGYEFIYPMGLTPKYDSPEHPGEGAGTHAPVVFGGERVGPVEISLAVDAGLSVGEPASPSHPLEVTRLDERRFQVHLAGEQIPDHDFILRYSVAQPASGPRAQAAGWVSGEADKEGFFLATLVPPGIDDLQADTQPLSREFIFVLDRSGSMSGEPILQARNALRACLRALNPGDTFRILLFDNELEWFQSEPMPAAQKQVELADAYLEKVQGRGGTEIVKALDAVLSLPVEPWRTRFVVFLTDGAVSAEERVLDGIRSRVGAARLFTFGIGPSVNRALLSRMADLGRGRSSFLQLDEDIEGAIIRFQDSISFPVLTDLALEWENGKAWDVYPARLPDLYSGQPLEICGRVKGSPAGPVRLTVRGRLGATAQPVTLSLALPQPAGKDLAIERLWARERVDDLFEQAELEPRRADKIRSEVLGLALEYNLVTIYTSFVAVDPVDAVAGGQPRIIHVAQPLPQGLQPGPFMPAQPMAVYGAMAPMPASASLQRQMPAAPSAAKKLLDRGRALIQKVNDSNQGYASPGNTGSLVLPTQEPAADFKDRESILRWLARTQKMNGSWGDSVEWTAAALLAFVRAQHTTKAGTYRQALRRAVRFLFENPGEGQQRFLRARALVELAKATASEADVAAAQAARLVLPPPANAIEQAALGQPVPPPGAVHSLDDLRLAALQRAALKVPDDLFSGNTGELARVWSALI